jgi:8-oxo-dGTP diphosphatase
MPKESTEPIYIGCELIIRKGDQLLLGLRSKRRFGANTWALPGGHMEHGERLIETACREAREELGMHIGAHEFCQAPFFPNTNRKLLRGRVSPAA